MTFVRTSKSYRRVDDGLAALVIQGSKWAFPQPTLHWRYDAPQTRFPSGPGTYDVVLSEGTSPAVLESMLTLAARVATRADQEPHDSVQPAVSPSVEVARI